MIVLDTCALLWWTLEPEKLSDKALTQCQKQEEDGRLLVSTISIWEIGIKQKQGKLDLGMSLEKYVSLLEKVSALHFIPVSNEVWIKSLALDWSHKDPVDRVVVATAALENLSLITKDSVIRKFYKKSLW
jgi:PIN domain nuclease of toxin-antitoxin system